MRDETAFREEHLGCSSFHDSSTQPDVSLLYISSRCLCGISEFSNCVFEQHTRGNSCPWEQTSTNLPMILGPQSPDLLVLIGVNLRLGISLFKKKKKSYLLNIRCFVSVFMTRVCVCVCVCACACVWDLPHFLPFLVSP